MLVHTRLGVRKVGQSHFNHRGGPVKLVLAFLSVWNVRQSHFNHCGGAVQIIQACLRVGKVPQSHLNHWEGPEMLLRICLSIGKVGLSRFNHWRRPVNLVLAFLGGWNVWQSHFKHCGGAYGKAGNGNEMETGNWKRKWKHNLLAVVVIQMLLVFIPRHPSPLPASSFCHHRPQL